MPRAIPKSDSWKIWKTGSFPAFPCAVCNREIRECKWEIHLTDGGDKMLKRGEPDSFLKEHGYTNTRFVGPECKRLIPQEYLFERKNNT